MYILGISCYYHDAAACLIQDGKIVAAAEEERFTRIKHDNVFPLNAIQYCLQEAGISARELNSVGFYEKPIMKFERIMQTFTECYPHGFQMFYKTVPSWVNEKLRIRKIISNKLTGYRGDILFADHHTSHAASAFFVSPFDEAAIVTLDGVGEWTTTSIKIGRGNKMINLKEIHFPHSLGLLYSTVTAYLGFQVNNDEYKVMGLAPYGTPTYIEEFKRLLDITEDGSFRMNMKYFDYRNTKIMWSRAFERLLGKPREPEEEIESRHKDIAASLQNIAEEIYFKIVRYAYKLTQMENLCVGGGVGLNSVANGKLYTETPFKRVFVQPQAGDGGGALGVAYYLWHQILGKPKTYTLKNAYLGPQFSNEYIKTFLDKTGAHYQKLAQEELITTTASLIRDGNIIGWFQGKMEWGPRALGDRSILANPTRPDIKDIVNNTIKHREDFRPFAGTILVEEVGNYFDVPENGHDSPFMTFVFKVKEDKKRYIPSITHIDGTCRIQTISKDQNQLYYDLIKEFERLTGVPILLNTSFNLKGEPTVCTPEEAYHDFLTTPMDYLVLNNFLITR